MVFDPNDKPFVGSLVPGYQVFFAAQNRGVWRTIVKRPTSKEQRGTIKWNSSLCGIQF